LPTYPALVFYHYVKNITFLKIYEISGNWTTLGTPHRAEGGAWTAQKYGHEQHRGEGGEATKGSADCPRVQIIDQKVEEISMQNGSAYVRSTVKIKEKGYTSFYLNTINQLHI